MSRYHHSRQAVCRLRLLAMVAAFVVLPACRLTDVRLWPSAPPHEGGLRS